MSDDLRALLRSLPTGSNPPAGFAVEDAPDAPLDLLTRWLREAIAAGCVAPHAATLATSGPDARTLIVKDITERGVWFATRNDGAKFAQLTADPRAVLVFYWREQGRQVRVHGTVQFASPEASAADFRERPAHSRAAAMLGTQSAPLPDDVDYPEMFAAAHELAEAEPDAGAQSWRSGVLAPERVEFWATTATSGQIRLEYRHDTGSWTRGRLWP